MSDNKNIANKNIELYILLFQLFRKCNLAYILHKKTRKSIFSNWLFIAIPILMYAVNLFIIILNDAFWNPTIKMSFVSDISNSVVLTVLFFVSFYLSSYYPSMFDEWIINGLDKVYFRKLTQKYDNKFNSRFYVFFLGAILLIIGGLAGYSFYSYSLTHNSIGIWIYHIGIFGRVYYGIILGILWYHSLSLLGMALSGGYAIFWSLKDKALNYVKEYYNKNTSIVIAVNFLICTFSYGLFYILGAILFILNDKIAEKQNEIINTFSNDVAAFFLIVIVLLLVIAAFVPLQELFKFMQKEKKLRLRDYEQKILQTSIVEEKEKLIKERGKLVRQFPIITSVSNKLFIIISIGIPLIGIIFQGMELFG